MASTGQGRQRCVDAAAFTSNEIQSTNNNMQNITSLNTRNKKEIGTIDKIHVTR
jgi:hypothetical protein